jgi:hypothetical protein
MNETLSRKERFLYTFERKKRDKLSFSPRLYYWYTKNKSYLNPRIFQKRGKPLFETEIPAHFLNKSQIEIFDLLNASPRYTSETMFVPLTTYNPVLNPFKIGYRIAKTKDGGYTTKIKTKYGDLTQVLNPPGGGMSGFPKEYYVKSIDDIKIMKYVLEHSHLYVLKPFIKYAEFKLRNRGVLSTFCPRSPYQRCILEYMGFIRTTLLLRRYPREMEDFFSFLAEKDNHVYEELSKSRIPILNFGENIDAQLTPPPMFKKYCIPYYQQRVKQLHQAGKYCHIHIDGDFKDLLPFFGELPFDGLEALTPQPAGDVSIEELKSVMVNKILLDGIPSILFLPQYSFDYVREYTMNLIKTFSPNLILGVSDEMPPNGDIRKIEMIAQIIENYDIA